MGFGHSVMSILIREGWEWDSPIYASPTVDGTAISVHQSIILGISETILSTFFIVEHLGMSFDWAERCSPRPPPFA